MKPIHIVLLILGLLFCTYIERDKTEKIPSATKTYKTGEILLPDYSHIDTLIILDGPELTSAMETLAPATDKEISDILNTYCKTK